MAAHPLPKPTCELGSTIRNDMTWDSVLANDVFKKQTCQLWRIEILPTRYILSELGKTIHDNCDARVFRCRRFGQIGNEIHSQSLPRSVRDDDRHIDSVFCVPGCFDAVTYFASGHVSFR